MRYSSLTVTAVLCAHLGVPSSLGATSAGGGAPAKIGVVDAAAAFVIPSNGRRRNSLPIHSGSITKSTAYEANQQLELSHILSPASRKQTLTHLASSIIDAPQTLSTSHNDDDNNRDDQVDKGAADTFDAKLEADAEAFFEQMMARRSSIVQGGESEESVANVEDEKASIQVVPNIPEETALGISVSATTKIISSDVVTSHDHFEGKSDDEIANEWHNDQMANALASVQNMNGLAALESIEQEEKRVHYEEWEQAQAKKQKVYEAAQLECIGTDDYAFQRSRLERQLDQPKTDSYVSIEAFKNVPRNVPDEPAVDHDSKSTSASYAFQQSRLQRQLAQPRPLTPHPPSSEQGSNQPPTSSDKTKSDVSQGSTVNIYADNTSFHQARLARQLAQPQYLSIESSHTLKDASQEEVLEAPVVEMSEQEIKARRAYYKHIEAMSAEIVRQASEAVDRVVEEQRRSEKKTLDAIEEAVALSAQSESAEISSGVHPDNESDNEAEADMSTLIQVPEVMIDSPSWEFEEKVAADKESYSSLKEEMPERSTTIAIPKKSLRDPGCPDSQSAPKGNSDIKSIFATILPERSLTDLSDETEINIARHAAIHFTRAAFDTTRAAASALGAVFEALRDQQADSIRSQELKSDEERSVLATMTSASNSALSFLGVIGRSDASAHAVEAAVSAAHQYSSFLAACGALGLRAGVKAKIYAEDYKQQMTEAQRRMEEAKAEEKRKMIAKIAKIAEEKRLEEERIAAERSRMELIRKEEEQRIASEKKALSELKARIEREKEQVEEERVAAEQRAIQDIRQRAEEKQRLLDMELEKNGLAEKKIVEVKNTKQEKTISPEPSPLFFVEQEKAMPFFFVDE